MNPPPNPSKESEPICDLAPVPLAPRISPAPGSRQEIRATNADTYRAGGSAS